MKKLFAILLVFTLVLGLCACGGGFAGKEKTNDKLQGYYISYDSYSPDDKICFEITDLAIGEYGGIMTNMDNTSEVSPWYIEDSFVYIDGQKSYQYIGNVLLPLEANDRITVDSNGMLEGKYTAAWGIIYFQYYPDGTTTYRNYNPNFDKWSEEKHGKYTIENSIVTVYEEDGDIDYEERMYIYNQQAYKNFWIRT